MFMGEVTYKAVADTLVIILHLHLKQFKFNEKYKSIILY